MLARAWMRLFNWLLLVQGLIVIGFMIYVAAVNFSSFVYVLATLGGYITLTAIIGLGAINGGRKGYVNLWAVLFFVLVLFHATAAIGFLFFNSKTVEILQKLNQKGQDDNNRVVTYLDNHRNSFKFASVIVVGVELLTFCIAACCTRSIANAQDPINEYDETDTRSIGLLSADTAYVSATPQTDKKRAEMSAKYGGLFQKRETNPYQQMVVDV